MTDRNDNHPRFQEPKVYSALLRKDAIPGTIVYRFKATDADSGRNGMLTFNFLLEMPGRVNLSFIDYNS